MPGTQYDDFRDVLSTAAGVACRCVRSELADTLDEIAATREIWSGPDIDDVWPGLTDELSDRGINIRLDSSPEKTRDQPTGMTTARAAIVESGSVILHENRLNQRSVSLMTQSLIVLCPSDELYPSLDDAARILRDISADGSSYATFVSGPSRTADIERQLTIGVQGPGALYVVFVDTD